MSEAARTLNYEGILVFTHNNKMDVMRILHKYDENGEREKIMSLTGPAREIIRNNQTVTCIFPDTREVMVERSKAQSYTSRLPSAIEAIADYYEFTTIGEERIAGRDTWVVMISPKDAYRYGYQLWIDRASHLLLKSELRDEDGTTLEQVMFTEISLHDTIDNELFKPTITGNEFTWYQYSEEERHNDMATDTPLRWQLTWMPSGFRLSNYDSNSMSSEEGVSLEHMVYSDGVSMVSVFIEKMGGGTPETPGFSRIGGVNVYAGTTDGYQVTAIGEVPQATVRRMVESLVPLQ